MKLFIGTFVNKATLNWTLLIGLSDSLTKHTVTGPSRFRTGRWCVMDSCIVKFNFDVTVLM